MSITIRVDLRHPSIDQEKEEKSMVKDLKAYGFKHIIKITKESL